MKEKLNLSVGILSWKSHKTLMNTLESYRASKIFEYANDITIFFQEGDDVDKEIASLYETTYILSEGNVGIGKGLVRLCEMAKTENIILLENDWVNIENADKTYEELSKGIELLNSKTADVVKYRHRRHPGDPLYTAQYAGREEASMKHLFDCIHWRKNPEIDFPDHIRKDETTGYYLCDSRYANQTNNPCMFKKDFYIKNISPFAGNGVDLEGKIDGWWQEQNFTVAHGEGLFTHYRLDR